LVCNKFLYYLLKKRILNLIKNSKKRKFFIFMLPNKYSIKTFTLHQLTRKVMPIHTSTRQKHGVITKITPLSLHKKYHLKQQQLRHINV